MWNNLFTLESEMQQRQAAYLAEAEHQALLREARLARATAQHPSGRSGLRLRLPRLRRRTPVLPEAS